MHRAPAVNFFVKRSRWHAGLIIAMGLSALAVLAVFAQGQALLDVRVLVLAFACLATCSIALAAWNKSPQGGLFWDGQHWYWSGFGDGAVCQLFLLMDFQSVVLILIKSDGKASFYLWLEAKADDTSWRPLRRAIVSSQPLSDNLNKRPGPVSEGDLA